MSTSPPGDATSAVGPGAEPATGLQPNDRAVIYSDDCLTILKDLPAESIHAVVTDPPYAIRSRANDSLRRSSESDGRCATCGDDPVEPGLALCASCSHTEQTRELMAAPMLGMQSQNWHEKATHSRGYADNDNKKFGAWCELWLEECLRVLKPGGHLVAFGGTRTWHRLAVAAEDAGFEMRDSLAWLFGTGRPKTMDAGKAMRRYAANRTVGEVPDGAAEAWAGWNSTLRPGHEPIVLARKPLDGTVTENLLKHGTGALHVKTRSGIRSNVFLDASQAEELDRDQGRPVSRFFWVAKPSGTERVEIDGISHPTVKPLRLMQELTALVARPGQTVLDPFAGSGTTVEACLLEGMNVIAVERDDQYLPLIRHRIERRSDPVTAGRARDQTGTPDLFGDIS